ncbi:hypothetical protein F4860DRAFT_165323 [Xylaria cubensis]|nr:hypothetical protein F4860DRAFT_165323 [Xylaria cubensis]
MKGSNPYPTMIPAHPGDERTMEQRIPRIRSAHHRSDYHDFFTRTSFNSYLLPFFTFISSMIHHLSRIGWVTSTGISRGAGDGQVENSYRSVLLGVHITCVFFEFIFPFVFAACPIGFFLVLPGDRQGRPQRQTEWRSGGQAGILLDRQAGRLAGNQVG